MNGRICRWCNATITGRRCNQCKSNEYYRKAHGASPTACSTCQVVSVVLPNGRCRKCLKATNTKYCFCCQSTLPRDLFLANGGRLQRTCNICKISPIFKLYGLYDPAEKKRRYIGITTKPLDKRLSAHIGDAIDPRRTDHKCCWIRSVLKAGRRPKIFLIKRFGTREELLAAEIWHISWWKALGCPLVNGTPGGEGNWGRVWSEEERLKRKSLDPNQEKAVVSMYREGFSSGQIAKHFKCSDVTIITTLKRLGEPARKSGRKNGLTFEQEAKLCKSYGEGVSAYRLGKIYRISTDAVLRIIKRLGIQPRTQTESRPAMKRALRLQNRRLEKKLSPGLQPVVPSAADPHVQARLLHDPESESEHES